MGEIIVVTLRDNIATARQCQSVAKQLKFLIDDHHCDFVLDFLYAGRISMGFREVMLDLRKAARKEAENAANCMQCRKGVPSECLMTGKLPSKKCPAAAGMGGMDGLSCAASPWECERSPSPM